LVGVPGNGGGGGDASTMVCNMGVALDVGDQRKTSPPEPPEAWAARCRSSVSLPFPPKSDWFRPPRIMSSPDPPVMVPTPSMVHAAPVGAIPTEALAAARSVVVPSTPRPSIHTRCASCATSATRAPPATLRSAKVMDMAEAGRKLGFAICAWKVPTGPTSSTASNPVAVSDGGADDPGRSQRLDSPVNSTVLDDTVRRNVSDPDPPSTTYGPR